MNQQPETPENEFQVWFQGLLDKKALVYDNFIEKICRCH
jgi:hypothetical protein